MERHLDLIRSRAAHLRLVYPWSLAGVVELPQVPHDLSEEVPRVVVIRFAEVRFAKEITPVRLALGLAGDTQFGEVGLTGDHHGAAIFCFGAETNGLIQQASFLRRLLLSTVLGAFDVVDAVRLVTAVLSLSVSSPNKADQKKSSTADGSHDGGLEGTQKKVLEVQAGFINTSLTKGSLSRTECIHPSRLGGL